MIEVFEVDRATDSLKSLVQWAQVFVSDLLNFSFRFTPLQWLFRSTLLTLVFIWLALPKSWPERPAPERDVPENGLKRPVQRLDPNPW